VRRKRLYIMLALLLLAVVGLQKLNLFSIRGVERGLVYGSFPAEWEQLVVDDANRKGITLMVDGKEYAGGKEPVYMTGHMAVMIPVSMVTQAFSCAVNYYDQSRLVIEQNAKRIELRNGEDHMSVNDVTMALGQTLTDRDGIPYLPMEVIEKGLSYKLDWNVRNRIVSMTSMHPGERILPYAYDYRKNGRVQRVKNQGTLGTCWSFASLQALETSLMPEEVFDFSEDHMTLNNSFSLTQNDGGEYTMSMAYLLAWQGPVLEEDDPYGDGYSPEGLSPVKHVQEIQILPSKDYEQIKRAVYLYGGVQSSLYTSLKNYKSRSVFYNRVNNAYCYIGTEKPNHDVVIIGWDDNYSRDNFNMDLEGDGAFICMNSWGSDFGDDGYFYVSYYDTNIGIHNILYTGVEPTDNYDRIYQSDLCGWIGQLGYGEETAYFANVYTAAADESLAAAGFYATGPETSYEVYLATDVDSSRDFSKKHLVARGHATNAGYYTVPLDKPEKLKAGTRFAVIVKITTPGSIHPIAIEYDAGEGKANVVLEDGEGYISLHGTEWERVETDQKCNVCLKAYTVNG